jgi:hypothetical protein
MASLSVNTIDRFSGSTKKVWELHDGTSWYFTHKRYGEYIASACFYGFFSKYRGVNSGDTIPNGFDWGTVSGMFETQIYELYGSPTGTPFNPENESYYTGDTPYTVNKITNFSSTQSALTVFNNYSTGISNTNEQLKYGLIIGNFVFNDFFDQKKSVFSPVYNKNEITEGLIFSAFSSSLLSYVNLNVKTPTIGYVSGFVKNNNKQTTVETVNLNNYVKSAATWVYNNYLGYGYIWSGPVYTSNVQGYTGGTPYKNNVPYQWASIQTGTNEQAQNSQYASGWVGDIRKYFHKSMKSLIKLERPDE